MKLQKIPAYLKPSKGIPSAKPGADRRGRARGVNTRLSLRMVKLAPAFILLSDPPKGTA